MFDFCFPSRCDPVKTCKKLAGKARKIPPSELPGLVKHSYMRQAFDPKLMKSLSEMFCDLDRVNIYIHTNDSCNLIEH